MRVRPEPTQLEHLSDASFLGRLLVFPANVRLDSKVIGSTNTLAYLASLTVTKEKGFLTLTPGANLTEVFTAAIYSAMTLSIPSNPHLQVIQTSLTKFYLKAGEQTLQLIF